MGDDYSVGSGKNELNIHWRTILRLLGAWTLLDLLCNVRFPGPEPALWYLLPSLDATALLVLWPSSRPATAVRHVRSWSSGQRS
jgi:hypothetical protein